MDRTRLCGAQMDLSLNCHSLNGTSVDAFFAYCIRHKCNSGLGRWHLPQYYSIAVDYKIIFILN